MRLALQPVEEPQQRLPVQQVQEQQAQEQGQQPELQLELQQQQQQVARCFA
jgi:hypothetical protein